MSTSTRAPDTGAKSDSTLELKKAMEPSPDPSRGMTEEELKKFCEQNPGHPACFVKPPPPDDPPD